MNEDVYAKTMMPSTQTLNEVIYCDLKHVKCPLPRMMLHKRIKKYRIKEQEGKTRVFYVEATDPMTALDIPELCVMESYSLLKHDEKEGVFTFEIEVKA